MKINKTMITTTLLSALSMSTAIATGMTEKELEERVEKMAREMDAQNAADTKVEKERKWLAPDGKRWTEESAMESHRQTYGTSTYDHAEEQRVWDSFNRKPEPEKNPNSGQLQNVWTGSATTVTNAWRDGMYFVKVSFGHDNAEGTAVVSVDNSGRKQIVGIPSPYNYEGNYHVKYENNTFSAFQYKTSGQPKIVSIHKQETPQLNDCAAGQMEYERLYCTGSFQITCEEGQRSRTCATNGGWLPWQTTRPPSCVTGNQACR